MTCEGRRQPGRKDGGSVEEKLRRYQNTLVIAGTGVIVFGIWSVVKVILAIFLMPPWYEELLKSARENQVDIQMIKWFLVIMPVLSLLLRLYVGGSARAEGLGRRSGRGYLAVGILLSLFALLNLIYDGAVFDLAADDLVDQVAQTLLDLTSLSALLEVIVSGFRVKTLARRLGREERG